MPTGKQILKKVRRSRTVTRLSTRDRKIAEYYGQKRKQEMWERDKATVRADNFKKAMAGLEVYREGKRQEKERQQTIAEARLKNLKKARKVKRSNNERLTQTN